MDKDSNLTIAGPGLRLAAFLIDLLTWLTFISLMAFFVTSSGKLETALDSALISLIVLLYSLLLIPLLNSLLISVLGGTLGKLATGTRIVDKEGKNLSFWRAFWRNHIGYMVSGTLAGLGFIWILVDEKKRGWHDLITGSFVVMRIRPGWVMGIASIILFLALNIFLGEGIYKNILKNRPLYQRVLQLLPTPAPFPEDFQIEPTEFNIT